MWNTTYMYNKAFGCNNLDSMSGFLLATGNAIHFRDDALMVWIIVKGNLATFYAGKSQWCSVKEQAFPRLQLLLLKRLSQDSSALSWRVRYSHLIFHL